MIEVSTPPELSPRASAVAEQIDRAVLWVATHWLAVLVGYGLTVLSLAASAPLCAARGYDTAASAIYLPFRLICHQRDDRSFHLHGEQLAFCQRDAAIVAGAIGIGLLFGLVRRWREVQATSFWLVVVLALPMALDGGTQLIGLRESTPLLRVITGVLFSAGVGWFALPHLHAGFASVGASIRDRYEHGKAAQPR